MRPLLTWAVVGLVLSFSTASSAQAPAGSTGECKDGTYTSTGTKRGACAGHGGVKDWYGAAGESKAGAAAPATVAAKTSAPAKAAAGSASVGSTGECKDGTYTDAESKRGACAGHGGVKEWHGGATPAKAGEPAAAPAAMAPAAPMAAGAPAPAPAAKTSNAPMATARAGGGPGQVWVNTNSKVYHCPGTEWYGKTKAGEYMSESAAKAAGNHADHGKACS